MNLLVLNKVTMLFGPAVHVVFDRYLENSMKSQTCEKRRDDVSRLTSVHIQGENIQDWNILLPMAASKLHTLL